MISIEEWRPADNLTLEPNALRAAKNITDSLALTAGPGAGKTEMLAQRADFLLKTNIGPYPKRILAISFKVDACKNLKERVMRRCGSELGTRFDSYTFHGFAKRIIDRFRPILMGNDALNVDYTIGPHRINHKVITFGDLVPLAVQILENSPVARNAIRQTFSHVFLDEFQDCTNEQYKLIHSAFGGTNIKLTAVGDTKQKIMGWAGALEGIFNNFASDFNANSLHLYRNFRSKPVLLRLQNKIIQTLDPDSVMPENMIRGSEGEIFVRHFEDSNQEAEYIADTVQNWICGAVPLSEIAVLVSKQIDQYAASLMRALECRHIPYRNEQKTQDISAEPLAVLINAYLSCLYNKRDPKAWGALMTCIASFDDKEDDSVIQRNIRAFIKENRRLCQTNNAAFDWWSSVKEFLKILGPSRVVVLSNDYENEERQRAVLNDFHQRLEDILQKESSMSQALKRFSGEEAVRILTIHKSKGLEFDSVIMMAVEEQTFWGNIEDERCVFFVGVSRAKKRLVLTSCDSRPCPQGFSGRWSESRSVQEEFIGYAQGLGNQ